MWSCNKTSSRGDKRLEGYLHDFLCSTEYIDGMVATWAHTNISLVMISRPSPKVVPDFMSMRQVVETDGVDRAKSLRIISSVEVPVRNVDKGNGWWCPWVDNALTTYTGRGFNIVFLLTPRKSAFFHDSQSRTKAFGLCNIVCAWWSLSVPLNRIIEPMAPRYNSRMDQDVCISSELLKCIFTRLY